MAGFLINETADTERLRAAPRDSHVRSRRSAKSRDRDQARTVQLVTPVPRPGVAMSLGARRRFTVRGVVVGIVTVAGLSAWQGQSIVHGVYIGAFAGAV